MAVKVSLHFIETDNYTRAIATRKVIYYATVQGTGKWYAG